jgi:hypothetical protein
MTRRINEWPVRHIRSYAMINRANGDPCFDPVTSWQFIPHGIEGSAPLETSWVTNASTLFEISRSH